MWHRDISLVSKRTRFLSYYAENPIDIKLIHTRLLFMYYNCLIFPNDNQEMRWSNPAQQGRWHFWSRFRMLILQPSMLWEVYPYLTSTFYRRINNTCSLRLLQIYFRSTIVFNLSSRLLDIKKVKKIIFYNKSTNADRLLDAQLRFYSSWMKTKKPCLILHKYSCSTINIESRIHGLVYILFCSLFVFLNVTCRFFF